MCTNQNVINKYTVENAFYWKWYPFSCCYFFSFQFIFFLSFLFCFSFFFYSVVEMERNYSWARTVNSLNRKHYNLRNEIVWLQRQSMNTIFFFYKNEVNKSNWPWNLKLSVLLSFSFHFSFWFSRSFILWILYWFYDCIYLFVSNLTLIRTLFHVFPHFFLWRMLLC